MTYLLLEFLFFPSCTKIKFVMCTTSIKKDGAFSDGIKQAPQKILAARRNIEGIARSLTIYFKYIP